MAGMDKVPCERCGTQVLPSTKVRTGGLCMPCYRGPNKKTVSQRVIEIAVRKRLMSADDAEMLARIPDRVPPLTDLETPPISNINELLAKRKETPDEILVGAVQQDLLMKESTQGFSSLSEQERVFYVVADMIGQIDNGGFEGYFFNTGDYAYLLQRALETVGSTSCTRIVKDAISTYGKVPSNDYDEMLEELASITNDFEENPWEGHDSRFYDLDENLPELLMDYVEENRDRFRQ